MLNQRSKNRLSVAAVGVMCAGFIGTSYAAELRTVTLTPLLTRGPNRIIRAEELGVFAADAEETMERVTEAVERITEEPNPPPWPGRLDPIRPLPFAF